MKPLHTIPGFSPEFPCRSEFDPRTLAAIDFMKANLQRSISIAEVAAVVGLSRSRLHSIFAGDIGLSPNQYLKALRLQRACELLETTFLSIKEVSNAVGYMDGAHFMRDFRRATGLTPSEYRSRLSGLSPRH